MSATDPSSAPASGLEAQLRSLILTNKDGNLHDAAQSMPPAGGQAAGPGPPSSRDTIATGTAQKPNRKRPNQAQRRQMSSELNVSYDPRAQQNPQQSAQPRHSMGQGRQPRSPLPTHRETPHGPVGGSPRMPIPRGGHHGQYTSQHNHLQSAQPSPKPRHQPMARQNFAPRVRMENRQEQAHAAQILNAICQAIVANSEIQHSEIASKENFRLHIERICQHVIARFEEEQSQLPGFPVDSVMLKCFGSLASGFATKKSDMDLGLLSPVSPLRPDEPGSPLPRLIEKALLEAGFGARLLEKTRVPIIKLCEQPPPELRRRLLAEREKWERSLTEPELEQDEEGVQADAGSTLAAKQAAKQPKPKAKDDTKKSMPQWAREVPPIAIIGADSSGEPQTHYLRQAVHQDLANYHKVAQGLVQIAGIRDLDLSSRGELSLSQRETINAICKAWVHGLYDIELSKQLEERWENFGEPEDQVLSLRVLLPQVEGESYLKKFKDLLTSEGVMYPEFEQDALIEPFIRFRNYPPGAVPDIKSLEQSLVTLKQSPIVRLTKLAQDAHESPQKYYRRVELLATQLEPTVGVKLIAQQYIAGIRDQSIRASTLKEFSTIPDTWHLSDIYHRHFSLSLAHEFEKALNKDLYADVASVQAYIEVLKRSMRISPVTSAYVVPITSRDDDVYSRIKAMVHPVTLSPNSARDKYNANLEFPKDGAGVQCDINFAAELALQNTALLRCYSLTDARVKIMVLFVKHWAGVRGINSGYRGTLGSYGYVLMVLHFLVNIARPFVCPNLQLVAPPPPPQMTQEEYEQTFHCNGYDVRFFRDEHEIHRRAMANQVNGNHLDVGTLILQFFEYYANLGDLSTLPVRGFDWGRDVLSLRTPGGLQTKQAKGWTGARTTREPVGPHGTPKPPQETEGKDAEADSDVKEVRHRYLLAIEDPFETDHNVARTVTHHGIVKIRDEFRRAWRLLAQVGKGGYMPEDLLQEEEKKKDEMDSGKELLRMLDTLHEEHVFDE